MPARDLRKQLKIENPCSANWDEMIGNEWVRFCEHCRLTVNDLSPLTPKRVRRLIANSKGRLCVRFKQDHEGLPIIKSVPQQLHQIRKRVSKIAAGAFTATLSLTSAVSNPTTLGIDQQPVATREFESNLGAVAFSSIIKGQVIDPAGMVIQGAAITLASNDKAYLWSTITDDQGQFSFEGLESGTYRLKIEALGFATEEINNIDLASSVTREFRQSLEVAPLEAQTEIVANDVVGVGGAMVVLPSHPLIRAAHDDDLEAMAALLTRENVNLRDENTGETALDYAVRNGNREMLQLLLSAGANVNSANDSKQTALMIMNSETTADIAWDLVNAGAKVNLKDEEGDTALIEIATEKNLPVLMALLHAGATVDAKNEAGQTALMRAASYDQVTNLRALIRAGADMNARDKEGKTALDYAMEEGSERAAKLLRSYGAVTEIKPSEN